MSDNYVKPGVYAEEVDFSKYIPPFDSGEPPLSVTSEDIRIFVQEWFSEHPMSNSSLYALGNALKLRLPTHIGVKEIQPWVHATGVWYIRVSLKPHVDTPYVSREIDVPLPAEPATNLPAGKHMTFEDFV